MKNLRKLIPAFAMLLLSAVLMSTASFAWFSMNTHVETTGLQVTAKSNASSLLISATNTPGTGKTDTVAATKITTNTDVYPVAYSGDSAVTSTIDSTTVAAGKWYTANNKNASAAADAVQNIKEVSLTNDLSNYWIEYNVYLTLSEDSEDVTKKVKVTSTLGSNSDAATSMYIKVGDSEELFIAGANNATTSNTMTISKSSTIKVTVYIYIDGTSTNVNSNYINGNGVEANKKTITGSVTLAFDLVD